MKTVAMIGHRREPRTSVPVHDGLLRRQPASRANALAIPRIAPEPLDSPGRPLNAETLAFMEPRFGHDFSRVRVHTDAKAAESARSINALAYTAGQDVVFANGQYAPGTYEGRRLLGHELTHVMQQREKLNQGSWRMGRPDHPCEQEASRIADVVSRGGTARVSTRSNVVQASEDEGPSPIWGGFRIGGDNGFIRRVRADLDSLNATQNGSALLRVIAEHRSPWYRSLVGIEPGTCGFLGGPIFYNANGCSVPDRCPDSHGDWTSVPNYVYLHHEIVHWYLYNIADKGTHADRECMATGLGPYYSSMPYSENRLRCELGLPVRPCYAGYCEGLAAPDCSGATPGRQSRGTK